MIHGVLIKDIQSHVLFAGCTLILIYDGMIIPVINWFKALSHFLRRPADFLIAPTDLYSMPSDENRATQKVSVDKTALGTTSIGALVYRLSASFMPHLYQGMFVFHCRVCILIFRNFCLMTLKPNQKVVFLVE
jgi:hypothetical protein